MKFFCVRKTQRLCVYALSKSPNIYSLKPLILNFLPFFTITILPFSRYFLHFLSLSALIFLYTSSSYHPLLLLFSSSSGPKLLHRYSIVTPSLLHRFDGQSMDYRWITDGLSYEKLRYFKGKKKFLEKHEFHDLLLPDEYW